MTEQSFLRQVHIKKVIASIKEGEVIMIIIIIMMIIIIIIMIMMIIKMIIMIVIILHNTVNPLSRPLLNKLPLSLKSPPFSGEES